MDSASDKSAANKSDDQWRSELTPLQYEVTRNKATEPPGSGEHLSNKSDGTYHCVCCGEMLFLSAAKYDSGCGWPSFFVPAGEKCIDEHEDGSLSMSRTEIVCSQCDAHLGHVFSDGPQPSGLRYCVNSASLKFSEKDDSSK